VYVEDGVGALLFYVVADH